MVAIGELVRSPQFPEIVKIKRFEAFGDYYMVEAVGQESNQFYEVMLDQEIALTLRHFNVDTNGHLSIEEVQKYLQYLLLSNEVKFSQTRALGNKNLIPLPHQIEAIYGRMMQVPHVRFLLADDPGAGKTIMSGMLIKELKARLSANRILILVPPLVLRQWQEELKEKFGEHFRIVNRSVVQEYGGLNPFQENDMCLASMYWASREEVKKLILDADFDLVIVDEAHKMAAYTHGSSKQKTSKTKLYQLGEAILGKTEHCVLLTATPHKGNSENFRHLMRLIDNDIFSGNAKSGNLKEKSNPFIIRRLKENLKNFDGTPIFPKRTNKTIQFNLTPEELDLYEAVTSYVQTHFNRAINKGNNPVAFAMMLLQRRLSSSIEAIYLSLKRRHERLEKLYYEAEKERAEFIKCMEKTNLEDYWEEDGEFQEQIEEQLEQAVADINLEELRVELDALKDLIHKAEDVRLYAVEKKYQELEETLFGIHGLLQHDEKILIFTESADTLNYLEKRLLEKVPSVAKIIGHFSMDARRKQVELFRNECQIMLATDAGGESINLQFCNQMINYDIPWNPNKLEQRMGRIHRIGQKNEVFVFNLVAQNTREGYVMTKLLDKMEQMKTDLGSDSVYDFMGDILEENFESLADLMQKAVLNRENLDEMIMNMEKHLSDENKKLIDLMHKEKITDDELDISNLRREKNDLLVQKIPSRVYAEMAEYILGKKGVRIAKSHEGKVMRIDRLPKFIRNYSLEMKREIDESYRFTKTMEFESENVPMISEKHPLFKLSLELMKKDTEGQANHHYLVTANVSEQLYVEIYSAGIIDGTGKILENRVFHLAKRNNGETILLNPNWIFTYEFVKGQIDVQPDEKNNLFSEAMKHVMRFKENVSQKREIQLNKVASFLENSFAQQSYELLNRLTKYHKENMDNRNSALINQVNTQMIDLEHKKEERMDLINRQKTISMKPPKKIMSLTLNPSWEIGNGRVIAEDYFDIVVQYEKSHGRLNVKQYENLGLVDFYSERFNGDERYIILTTDFEFTLSKEQAEDLQDVLEKVYIYIVDNTRIAQELIPRTLR